MIYHTYTQCHRPSTQPPKHLYEATAIPISHTHTEHFSGEMWSSYPRRRWCGCLSIRRPRLVGYDDARAYSSSTAHVTSNKHEQSSWHVTFVCTYYKSASCTGTCTSHHIVCTTHRRGSRCLRPRRALQGPSSQLYHSVSAFMVQRIYTDWYSLYVHNCTCQHSWRSSAVMV
jgi:hypothetical protein